MKRAGTYTDIYIVYTVYANALIILGITILQPHNELAEQSHNIILRGLEK